MPRRRTGISFEAMAASRAERLINLVICLLSTRQFLSAEKIREIIPGYDESDGTKAGDEAFKRMFERDKADLRDLGIPLEVGSGLDGEEGYRIREGDYELPPISFDAAEAAALGLAARFWRTATLGEAANSALLKLRAAGIDVIEVETASVPMVDSADPNLAALIDAAQNGQVVTFEYQKAGALTSESRTLQPWGLPFWHGRWYVVGFDTDRDEPRSFRLSRIDGKVKPRGPKGAFVRPDDVDLVALVASRGPEHTSTALIRVSGDGAGQLRRIADSETDGVLTVTYIDLGMLARQVASAGRSAQVLEPPELIEAVRARLAAVAGRSEINA